MANWNSSSTADALLILSLTNHNVFTQLSVCTYYFAFYFFFQIHISIHQQSTHLCFGSAVEHFMAALKVLDTTLASSFPASFYFPLNMTDPSWILLDHPPLHYPSNPHTEFMLIPEAACWSGCTPLPTLYF